MILTYLKMRWCNVLAYLLEWQGEHELANHAEDKEREFERQLAQDEINRRYAK